jgi:NADPH-dependent glutamate synthase beta subunit-like oxidoreductase/ferredoxin
MAVSLRSTRALPTGTWRTFRPTYLTRESPCNLDCPAGTDVLAFLAQVAANDALGAWRTILRTNPFPGVCGRVCYHPCESECNRAALDTRIAVHTIERSIADEVALTAATADLAAEMPAPGDAAVAIVGAGPAGLSCAYHLARRGVRSVVFDAADEPGGMLRYGIPAYRLPRGILDAEIGLLRRLGVSFEHRAKLGTSLTWQQLESYDAVFVAVGAQRSRPATLKGEELAGVHPAIDFLRDINTGKPFPIGRRVIVVGGGNTAIDAARVALRGGAAATIVYRRCREDMPAHPDEVAQAEAEGVQFVFNAAPVKFRGRARKLSAVEFQRTRPGPPDASGRRTPEPIPGELFTLSAGHALLALGEELERDVFDGVMDLARGRLRADRFGRTGDKPLYAGGDAATGAGTVVEAIASGRRAAEAIDARLHGREVLEETGTHLRVERDGLNFFYFPSTSFVLSPRHLAGTPVENGFDEVARPVSWAEAVSEAGRCCSCGLCTSCSNCVVFCPDGAVHRHAGGYEVDLEHCKGCGLCVAECPRGAMLLTPEETR